MYCWQYNPQCRQLCTAEFGTTNHPGAPLGHQAGSSAPGGSPAPAAWTQNAQTKECGSTNCVHVRFTAEVTVTSG
jgi:hypothetical protein